MSSKIDTNVDNYTDSELLVILGLTIADEDSIIQSSNDYIEKFTSENNQQMATFFQDVQDKLLNDDNNYETPATSLKASSLAKQTNKWAQNNSLSQLSNPVQNNKITDRVQKINVYENNHVPMKQEQLGISNTKLVDVQQDKLNPTLQNTITRIVSLDSKYRQSANDYNGSSTNYTLDLSEQLVNVLSMKVYTIQVPQSWYSIDSNYGNTCLFVSFYSSSGILQTSVSISIESGNYTPTQFVTYLTAGFTSAGFSFTGAIPVTNTPVYYNQINGKMTMNLYDGTYTDSETGTVYTVDGSTILTFFDPTGELTCSSGGGCPTTMAINQTLGWNMGFRVPLIAVNSAGNTGTAVIDLYGPKYLILVIDDLNQNHINNGVVGITEYSKTLKMPTYYSPDLPYTCTPANPTSTTYKSESATLETNVDAGIILMDKYDATYAPTVSVLPSAPRTLTQSQIYAINEIMKNNNRNDTYRLSAPTTSDVLAIVPLPFKSTTTGDLTLIDSSTLQLNKRTYFGPVNIERMRVKLLDDRGNILNLNGSDWNVTLICELLYQY
jgi:hypothetical protein